MTPFNLHPLGKILFILAIIFSSFQAHSQDLSIEASLLAAICVDENSDCTAAVSYPFSLSNAIEGNLTLTYQLKLEGQTPMADTFGEITGTFPNFAIEGTYPLGVHAFIILANDGIGNNTKTLHFNVANCSVPILTCVSGLTVTLMPQPDGCCALALWAYDLMAAAPASICGEDVTLSIHKLTNIENGSDVPSANQYQPGIVFDCNSNATENIRIYAWDSSFNPYSVQPNGNVGGANYTYCETYIPIQEFPTCSGAVTDPVIAGVITTEENEGIEDVEVGIIINENDATVLSYSDGGYEYSSYDNGLTANITPYKNTFPLNGVSVLDLVLISKHILGIEALDSPYKLIAADVNGSGTVTTLDLIEIQQLILNQISEFPNNTSWRFVDANYYFPTWQDPWEEVFPEIIQYNGEFDDVSQNFIGIKIGDVNGSAITN